MNRSWIRIAAAIAILLAVPWLSVLGQTPSVEFPPAGGVVTLYAHDAQLATLSFVDGKSGLVVHDHGVYNRDSHLAFEIYETGSLRVGLQGRQRGTIIDLGSAEELETRYGYRETVGKPQGFASIHRQAGKLVILKDQKAGEFQPLREAALLGSTEESTYSAPVRVGHIYVARIVDGETEIVMAKLRVLAFTPGQCVTIRWERL